MDKKIAKAPKLRFIRFRQIWFCVSLLVISFLFFSFSILANAVYITDSESEDVQVNFTRTVDPIGILGEKGISLNEADEVSYMLGRSLGDNEIAITRSFPVFVEVDGKVITHNMTSGTVEDVLETLEITLGEYDEINCDMDRELFPMARIIITRVDYRTYSNEVVIPKVVNTKSSSLIRRGTTRIIEQGSDGLKNDIYRETIIDGKIVETELIRTDIVKPSVDELQLYGSDKQISTIDYSSEFPLDENGIPIKYEKVYHNQRATGYYAGKNAWGASGVHCQAGTVAVRSNEIPYGSKLYIRTPDGKFVYGYAVANDTGTGLMQNVIDVDLYYDSYKESCWNEVRWVDIYVLETGDGVRHKPRTPISMYL